MGYNPYTVTGTIIVDGVVASTHSSWILDAWVPDAYTKHLPDVYQALFWPGRVLYRLVGAQAAYWLDVNIPQASPDTFGHGPQFLASCIVAFITPGAITLVA